MEYRIAEHIAWITLNRPDNHNALSDALTGELDDAVHQANADDGVRFIVLGAKGKTFC
ncbi:MAG: enoyl-CoA hydratase/isomerase family protein, partial [Candidatus Krumholzibacteriota bacterium]|nr:enoyl-CoA hydratase/isomerase family protein [Candidatus Krumholzibacteriota bacterium]